MPPTNESQAQGRKTNPGGASRWLPAQFPRSDAQIYLFCFPFAGGGASTYYPWTNSFVPAIEVCPIQLPGREDRFNEPPYTNLTDLVQALGTVLSPYLDHPFAFFGHSMGGLIAFELTRHLLKQYQKIPTHLFVSAASAPQLGYQREPISTFPDHLFLDQIIQRYNAIPQTILQEPQLLNVVLSTMRADFHIVETFTYQDGEPLACPITALGGKDDVQAPITALSAWKDQTSQAFFVHMFNGGHFFVRDERQQVLDLLSHSLSQYL